MVKAKTGLTSAKRFGARYGRRVKELFENAEKEQRKLHKCPYCHAIKVKRTAVGIWGCQKCCAKFSGKAYVPYEKARSAGVEEAITEESLEEEPEIATETGEQ
ncbi:50S ribosomal protein L37ae [Candidatus Woesearchaeota archaeon]|nr:50S ribosomal protein L37ae [Candidatus Woesearchaeota archaeon]